METPRSRSHGIGSIFVPSIPPTCTSKCRCGPVDWPRLPSSAIVSPAFTTWPAVDEDLLHVAVDGDVAVLVLDVDGDAEAAGRPRLEDDAVHGRVLRRHHRRREVDAGVQRAPAAAEAAGQPGAGHGQDGLRARRLRRRRGGGLRRPGGPPAPGRARRAAWSASRSVRLAASSPSRAVAASGVISSIGWASSSMPSSSATLTEWLTVAVSA